MCSRTNYTQGIQNSIPTYYPPQESGQEWVNQHLHYTMVQGHFSLWVLGPRWNVPRQTGVWGESHKTTTTSAGKVRSYPEVSSQRGTGHWNHWAVHTRNPQNQQTACTSSANRCEQRRFQWQQSINQQWWHLPLKSSCNKHEDSNKSQSVCVACSGSYSHSACKSSWDILCNQLTRFLHQSPEGRSCHHSPVPRRKTVLLFPILPGKLKPWLDGPPC